eukprot:COSAG01_NODE_3328_length_6249_cov_3.493821_2_plen_250_part_00
MQACVLLQRQSAHTVLEDMSRLLVCDMCPTPVHSWPSYATLPVRLKSAVCLVCRFLNGLGCQLFTTLPAGPPSNWSPGNKAARLRQPRQRCDASEAGVEDFYSVTDGLIFALAGAAVCYVAIGSAMVRARTGSFGLPHGELWAGLAGLVVDGVNYSLGRRNKSEPSAKLLGGGAKFPEVVRASSQTGVSGHQASLGSASALHLAVSAGDSAKLRQLLAAVSYATSRHTFQSVTMPLRLYACVHPRPWHA